MRLQRVIWKTYEIPTFAQFSAYFGGPSVPRVLSIKSIPCSKLNGFPLDRGETCNLFSYFIADRTPNSLVSTFRADNFIEIRSKAPARKFRVKNKLDHLLAGLPSWRVSAPPLTCCPQAADDCRLAACSPPKSKTRIIR